MLPGCSTKHPQSGRRLESNALGELIEQKDCLWTLSPKLYKAKTGLCRLRGDPEPKALNLEAWNSPRLGYWSSTKALINGEAIDAAASDFAFRESEEGSFGLRLGGEDSGIGIGDGVLQLREFRLELERLHAWFT